MGPVRRVSGLLTLACATALLGGASRADAAPSSLKVQVDKSKVDLKQHRLEVKMSHPAGKVKIEVYAESDAVLADEEQDFSGRPAGVPLIVSWTPSSDAAV